MNAQRVIDAFARSDREEEQKFGKRLQTLLPTFSVPYWDWAQRLPQGFQEVPEIFRQRRISISAPGPPGTQEEIVNPLYSFNFKEVRKVEFPNTEHGFSTWLNTVRYPHTTIDENDVGQPDKLQETFKLQMRVLRGKIYHLLTSSEYANFKAFSDQLSQIHGAVHDLIGGGGHMADVDYACFDPIFSLHHGYVDFLFRLWQGLYPNEDMGDEKHFNTSRYGHGFYDGRQSVLPPFHHTQDGLLNSTTVWNAADFGSNYLKLGKDRTREELRAIIQALYYEGSAQGLVLNVYPDLVREGNISIEYFATVSTEHYALKCSFLILFFMGDDTTQDDVLRDENLVGTFGVFANNPSTTGCERCKEKIADNRIDSMKIPLTVALLERIGEGGDDKTLDRENVGPYLKRNLKWKIILANGTPVDTKDVPSLKVEITSNIVDVSVLESGRGIIGERFRLPEDFPKYKSPEKLFDMPLGL